MLSRAKTLFRDASSVVATAFHRATVDMRSRHAPAKFASITGVGAMSPLSCAFNWLTNSAFTRTKFGSRRRRPRIVMHRSRLRIAPASHGKLECVDAGQRNGTLGRRWRQTRIGVDLERMRERRRRIVAKIPVDAIRTGALGEH